jgi:predicted metal-dependent phosphoesterase TrpH
MGGAPDRSPLRIDTHVHTGASYDAFPTVEAVLTRAAEIGLDGVVVTDHDTIHASLDAVERAPAYGLLALPGVEVSTADGHLLAIGVEERPRAGDPLRATVDAVHDAGGVAVVPHPFQRSRHGVPAAALRAASTARAEVESGDGARAGRPATDGGRVGAAGGARLAASPAVDGIETYNAHCLTGVRNGQAASYAAAHGHPTFGGSDAHRARLVGRGYTEVAVGAAPGGSGEGSGRGSDPSPDPDPGTVLEAMRAGRTRAGGRRMPIRRYVGKVAESVRIRATGLR